MKDLSVSMKASLARGTIIPRLLVKGDFGSGTHGFVNDVGDFALGGVTYRGTGTLATVTSMPGVSDLSIPGLTVAFSGLNDAQVLASFFNEEWHQRPMSVSIALFDPDDRNLIDAPDVAFAGYMDDAKRKGQGDGAATLEIVCEDSSRRMTRTFQTVRSDADQRERDPTDEIYVRTGQAGEDVYWNQPTPKTAAKAKTKT